MFGAKWGYIIAPSVLCEFRPAFHATNSWKSLKYNDLEKCCSHLTSGKVGPIMEQGQSLDALAPLGLRL